jgi:IclR family KDG regulon transcriptional repressor
LTRSWPGRASSATEGVEAWADRRTAVDKACDVLEAFPGGGATLGVTELAHDLRLSKSTVFRLLRILERNGFLERNDGRYRLGGKLSDLGSRVYEVKPGVLQDLLSPFVAALYESTRYTVNLGVLHGGEVVLVDRLHGQRSKPHLVMVGSRFRGHGSALGKALLARDADATERILVAGLVPLTPHTIVNPDAFRSELDLIRRTGVATSRQEARAHLNCIAVALTDEVGRPLAALGLSGMTLPFDAHVQGTLRAVAADAERVLRQSMSR